jgi:hypothetical protein
MDKGPDYWPVLYDQCKARQQSPINIITSATVYDAKLKPVKIYNPYKKLDFDVINSEKTGK